MIYYIVRMIKMQKIYQRFDLDLEKINNLCREELLNLNLYQAGKTIRQDLIEKGYVVLESDKCFSGTPESIIIGGEIGKNHKEDFYKLTKSLGLQSIYYMSETCYTQINETD